MRQFRRKSIGVIDLGPGERLALSCVGQSKGSRSPVVGGAESRCYIGVRALESECFQCSTSLTPPAHCLGWFERDRQDACNRATGIGFVHIEFRDFIEQLPEDGFPVFSAA